MCHAKYDQKWSMAKEPGHGELIPLALVSHCSFPYGVHAKAQDTVED